MGWKNKNERFLLGFSPLDVSCARRGSRRPSERRRWGWKWRPWASGWRRRRRDVLNSCRRCHDSLPKTQRLNHPLNTKRIRNPGRSLPLTGESAAEVSPEAKRGAEESRSSGAAGNSGFWLIPQRGNASTFENQRLSGSRLPPDSAVHQGHWEWEAGPSEHAAPITEGAEGAPQGPGSDF